MTRFDVSPDGPLRELGQFIAAIRDTPESGTPSLSHGTWWYRAEDGTVYLSREESAAYRALIARFVRCFAGTERLSSSTIQRLVQDAVFDALDLGASRGGEFAVRLQSALERLQRALTLPATEYTCFVQMAWMEFGATSPRMGDVRFRILDETLLSEIEAMCQRGDATGDTVEVRKQLMRTDAWGQHVAMVSVQAQDFEAAEGLARRRVERAIDLVNYFADLIPYSLGWLYLPGDAGSAHRVAPMVNTHGQFQLSRTHVFPLAPFSWKKLEANSMCMEAFNRLCTLSTAAHPKSFGAAIVTSAAWCGRGTVERRRNQAFLLFAIALETLLLAGNDREKISYRFRVRGAHLLAGTAEREQVADDLKRLYKIRSQIVHSGSYDVTENDLGRLRALAKQAVLLLLDQPDVHGLRDGQIGRWLDAKILR